MDVEDSKAMDEGANIIGPVMPSEVIPGPNDSDSDDSSDDSDDSSDTDVSMEPTEVNLTSCSSQQCFY